MLEKIRELFERRKYYDCIRLLEQSAKREALPLELLKLLAACYSNTEQYDKAIQLCQDRFAAATTQKERSDWQYRLAGVYLDCSPEKALGVIKEHLVSFKTSLHGHALAIRICTKLNMHGEGETYYAEGCRIVKELSVTQKDKYAGLIAGLHKAYAEYLEKVAETQQDPSRAMAAVNFYRAATEVTPKDPNGWYALGKILYSQNNWMEAESALKKALELRPGEPYITRLIARVACARGDHDSALKTYKEIPLQRRQGYMLVEAGQCAEHLGNDKEAGRFYKQAVEREPHKHYHHLMLGQLYKRLGAKMQAIEELKVAADLYRKEHGLDHKMITNLIADCERMNGDEEVTFRESQEVKRCPGKITRYVRDRGFGFIECNGKRFFFHISEVVDNREKGEPRDGQVVSFLPTEGQRGPAAAEIARA